MKFRLVFISFLFISTCFTASAQTIIGIKGGLNLSNFNGAYPTLDPRVGFHAGFFIQEVLAGKSHLRLEFQYSQKGARQDVGSFQDKERLLINYNYLEMPVIIKYNLFRKLSPFIGLQGGFLVKGSVRVKGSSRHSDIISGESKGKLGAIGGVEYILTKKVGVDLRYDRGLFGKGQKSHALQLGFSILLKN